MFHANRTELYYTDDNTFSSDFEGYISGIRVQYLSGGVTCNSDPHTYWGCEAYGGLLGVYVLTSDDGISHGDTHERLAYPSMYDPRGISFINCWYTIDSGPYNGMNDDILELRGNMHVKRGQKFRFFYPQALMATSLHNNRGETRARVSFIKRAFHVRA